MATPTSLASICDALVKAVRADVQLEFDARISAVIGNPEQVDVIDPRNDHYLNFFFYQFEPFGFDSDTLPREALLLRTRCLITAFAIQESEEASAGFNDLKLIGEAIRIFHQTPVRRLTVLDGDDQPVDYQVQTIFHALGPDQINNLWTTQGGDVAYRPSVVYEVALTPVLPTEKEPGSPLVGALGLDVHADMAKVTPPPSGVVYTPVVTARKVNTSAADWAPIVCFVANDVCAQSLSFALGSAELAGFTPVVWVAGEVGTDVQFVWELWNSTSGWATIDTTQTVTIQSTSIDPDAIAPSVLVNLSIPEGEDGESILANAGQAVVYASRTYTRGSDQAELDVRSNPLLVTIYETRSPP